MLACSRNFGVIAFTNLRYGPVYASGTQVLNLLKDLQDEFGLSYIFISHDLAVIRAMAHRVMVMKNGDVVEEGETLALFDAPQQAYTRELLAAAHLA